MNKEIENLYRELFKKHEAWYFRGNDYEKDVAQGIEIAMDCMEEQFPPLKDIYTELYQESRKMGKSY